MPLEPTEDDYIHELVERFRAPEEQRRLAAVHALARLGRRAVPALLEVLRQDDWALRRYAVAVFAEAPDARAVPLLCLALRDVDWEVRREAARALKVAAPPEAAEALLPLLSPAEGHPQVRLNALEALATIRERDRDARVSPDVWERVVASVCAVLQSEEWRLHAPAAGLLGALRAPAAVDALWATVGSADLGTALAVTEALGRIGGPRVIEPLRVALSHRELDVRAGACGALGRVGGEEALMLLAWALRTREPVLRRAAARAVEHLAHTAPTPALRSTLEPLRRLLSFQALVLSREERQLFGRALRQVEAVTRAMHDLPLPATPGGRSAQLPVPAAGGRSGPADDPAPAGNA